TTFEDVSTNLVLVGTDIESAVTYAILSGPTQGTLGTLNINTGGVTYTPATNYLAVRAIVIGCGRISDSACVDIQCTKRSLRWPAQDCVSHRAFDIAAHQNQVRGNIFERGDILIVCNRSVIHGCDRDKHSPGRK